VSEASHIMSWQAMLNYNKHSLPLGTANSLRLADLAQKVVESIGVKRI